MFTIKVEHHLGHDARHALALLTATLQENRHMNAKLAAAITALQGEIAEERGQTASILTFIVGVPALVAAAVAQALADNDVDDDAAAASIDEARQTASDQIDTVVGAINAKPTEGDTPIPVPGEQPSPADPAPVDEPADPAPADPEAEKPADPSEG